MTSSRRMGMMTAMTSDDNQRHWPVTAPRDVLTIGDGGQVAPRKPRWQRSGMPDALAMAVVLGHPSFGRHLDAQPVSGVVSFHNPPGSTDPLVRADRRARRKERLRLRRVRGRR